MKTEDNNNNNNNYNNINTHHFANKSDFPHPAAPLTRNGAFGAVQSDTCSFKSL